MATSVRLIRRYVWLIDTIRHAGCITLEEINRKWLKNTTLRLPEENEIPERTFHRHRQAIADIFEIDILCDRYNGNTYYIDNDEILDQPSFTSWLFNGLAIDNQMMGNRDVTDRIMFEETPGGSEYLSPIIEALTKRCLLKVEYRRFNFRDIRERIVEPYGLKQSGRRWYLVGKIRGFDILTVFALDRIESLQLLDENFDYDPKIDVHKYFEDVIGVNVDDDYDCEPVTVRIFGPQRAYIEALPLHKSQRLISRNKDYSDYEFNLRAEYEFQRELLRLGPDAEVLSPQWLKKELQEQAHAILKRYQS